MEARLGNCEKHNQMQDQTLGSHEESLAALQEMLQNLERQMGTKLKQLEALIAGAGQAPSAGGGVDLGQFQMVLAKIQSDLDLKAEKGDVNTMLEMLKKKADRTELQKEVERLERLIEQLT